MSTKVHDDDETFDEVDVILEDAKAGIQMKRSLERKSRRNINLSDIPENFAHVPASSKIKSEQTTPPTPPPPLEPAHVGAVDRVHCKQRRSLAQVTRRWFTDRFMVCVSAMEYGATCDTCGRSVVTSVHLPSRRANQHHIRKRAFRSTRVHIKSTFGHLQ